MILIKTIKPTDASDLIAALDKYQSSLYPSESNHLDSIEELTSADVHFVGAFESGVTLIGIGAVKIVREKYYGEIKRVFVAEGARGKRVAEKILIELESYLAQRGINNAKLETGIHQTAAISFYSRIGYKLTDPFGDYVLDPLSVFMEKSFQNGSLKEE